MKYIKYLNSWSLFCNSTTNHMVNFGCFWTTASMHLKLELKGQIMHLSCLPYLSCPLELLKHEDKFLSKVVQTCRTNIIMSLPNQRSYVLDTHRLSFKVKLQHSPKKHTKVKCDFYPKVPKELIFQIYWFPHCLWDKNPNS